MTSLFEKDYLPAWCERCDKQGFYFVDDPSVPCLARHKRCGYEILSASCLKCEAGFAFPLKPGSQPSDWTCEICHTKYPLAVSIFDSPIDLYLEDELPPAFQERIQRGTRPRFTPVTVLALILWIVIVAVLLFWPFGLGYWLGLTTDNPVWFIVGFVAFFPWLIFGMPVIKRVFAWLSDISMKINAM